MNNKYIIIKTKAELILICQKHGIELNKWEKGMPHHPKSVELMEAITAVDSALFDDNGDWSTGGDGDNGESLMYNMDIVFELEDLGYKVARTAWQ